MQFVYTEEEHRKVMQNANMVSVYAEELKRLTGITDGNKFSKYARNLITNHIERINNANN